MIKFSSHSALVITSLFLMISCSNISSEEKQDNSKPSPATVPNKLKGVTVEQRKLNDIFESLSSKDSIEIEQEILSKPHQDSVKQHTSHEPQSQKASKIETEKALKIKAKYGNEE